MQPALEPEWDTDPWEVAAVDGYLYGRGTSDNKGPVLAFIYAVKELLQAEGGAGALPVNVAFLIEGAWEGGLFVCWAEAGRAARGHRTMQCGWWPAQPGAPPGVEPASPARPTGPGPPARPAPAGEEENGSAGFREAVSQNLRWFEGTRLAVISNTLWVGERTPCLTYGMRGMIAFSIDVKGEGASERAREQRMP